jgi:hypothetical protein
MEMFLTILLMSVVSLALCVAAFGLATANARREEEERQEARPAVAPPHFFAHAPVPPAVAPRVPIEVLLSDIERHIRLEQAAAEAFLEVPTRDALRSRTSSPLLN